MSEKKDQLSTLYQQGANEQPSSQLDKTILEMAKEHQEFKANSSGFRKYLPYSMVASIGLIALLILSFPQYYFAPPQSQEPLPTFDAEPALSEVLEEEKIPVSPLPAKPQSAWQYQQSDTSVMQKAEKQRAMNRVKEQSKADKSDGQRLMASAQAKEEQRLTQLALIKKAVDSGDKEQALIAIQQYVDRYGTKGLTIEYIAIYQKSDKR